MALLSGFLTRIITVGRKCLGWPIAHREDAVGDGQNGVFLVIISIHVLIITEWLRLVKWTICVINRKAPEWEPLMIGSVAVHNLIQVGRESHLFFLDDHRIVG